MLCRYIKYLILYILYTLVLTSLINESLLAQAQSASVFNDSIPSLHAAKFPEKNSIKDSLVTLKDSVISSLWKSLGRDTAGLSRDSLRKFIHSFPARDSLKKFMFSRLGLDSNKVDKDSLLSKLKSLPGAELKKALSPFEDKLKKPSVTSLLPVKIEKPQSWLQTGGGYINYNYMFRSALDTPYIETNVGQHMINAGMDFAVAGLPFQVSYYGRQSNSAFLRDYNDFRIAFNVPAFRKLRQDQLRSRLSGVIGKIQDPGLLSKITTLTDKIRQLKQLLNGTEFANRYIKSKQTIAYEDQLPDDAGDKKAVVAASKKVVALYEEKQALLQSYEGAKDSLQHIYAANTKKIGQLQHLINGNMYTAQGTDLIKDKLNQQGLLDKKTARLLKTAYAVRSFAIGRTLPNMTNLTVKNINVKGINFEYNTNNIYAAVTAGVIDFRSRDFIYGKASKVPQHVYAASLGYGLKEGNHVIVTGYSGKKQIISNSSVGASSLSGMSIEAQWIIHQYLRITGEVAQSTSPVYASGDGIKKQGFKINDNSNKAYSLQLYGYIPFTKTRLEAYYQRTGINFQNFTNYRINSNASTWNLRLEQYLWKKQLRLLASAKKNDYSNPFVIQQYNSNTIFTSFSATFRKRNFPSFTVGYMPSSQYTIVSGQVAENRYQSLTMNVAHTYRIGLMTANGSISYNKFYNSGTDTGFLYYNAQNFFTYHQFSFPLFTANVGYARTANKQYSLDVMEGGVAINYRKHLTAGCGVKINKYNTTEIKSGIYGNLRASWKQLGDITLWYERGYLPGSLTTLMVNEWCSISFTRYFNNTWKL